ncbi:MAG: hypothetical protein Q9174_005525 [Haloplaca sp. 1 TL-2023]
MPLPDLAVRRIPKTFSATLKAGILNNYAQEWQEHVQRLQQMSPNPYDRCVCGVVDLDNHGKQLVNDPDTGVRYIHRKNCLAYPSKTPSRTWQIDIRGAGGPKQYLQLVKDFNATARSPIGAMNFNEKTLETIEKACGVSHADRLEPTIPSHCSCYLFHNKPWVAEYHNIYRPPLKNDCTLCASGLCCPCCEPAHYGLTAEDIQAARCEDCGDWCQQCNPFCFGPNAGPGAAHSRKKAKPSFINVKREASLSVGRPRNASEKAQAQKQPKTHTGNEEEDKSAARLTIYDKGPTELLKRLMAKCPVGTSQIHHQKQEQVAQKSTIAVHSKKRLKVA